MAPANVEELAALPRNHPASLLRWSQLNAMWVAVGFLVSAGLGHAAPLAVCAAGSFVYLLFVPRRRHAANFGLANTITLLRLLMVLLLATLAQSISPWWVSGLAFAVLTLDGLDGYVARRRGENSVFGAMFDMETDALLVLVLCVRLWQAHAADAWILLGGLLRYVYVVSLVVSRRQDQQRRSRFARIAFVVLVGGLLLAFVEPPAWRHLAALVGTVLVSCSFARSFYASYRRKTSRSSPEAFDLA